jgi:hypothetical protein
MKPIFYTKIPKFQKTVYAIIFFIITILTFGFAWRYYDYWIETKYYLNRRILSNLINQENVKFTKSEITHINCTEYKFESINLWIYERALELASDNDEIGLFTSNKLEDAFVISLIRKLKQL